MDSLFEVFKVMDYWVVQIDIIYYSNKNTNVSNQNEWFDCNGLFDYSIAQNYK